MQPYKKTETIVAKSEIPKELKDKIFTDYTTTKDSVDSIIESLNSFTKIVPCYPDRLELEKILTNHKTYNSDINTSVANEYGMFRTLLKNMHLHTDEYGVDFIYMDELYKDNNPELYNKLKELIERNK